jgi:hypothetical protein
VWFGVLKNAHPEMRGDIRAEMPTKHIRDPLEDREQSARPGMNIGFHEDGSNSTPLTIPTDDIGSAEAGREGLEESCGDLVINARTHSLPLVQIDEKKTEGVARPLGPAALDREEPAKRLLVIGFCGLAGARPVGRIRHETTGLELTVACPLPSLEGVRRPGEPARLRR